MVHEKELCKLANEWNPAMETNTIEQNLRENRKRLRSPKDKYLVKRGMAGESLESKIISEFALFLRDTIMKPIIPANNNNNEHNKTKE